MKDKKKILGALLRKWRKKAGISHYAIVKAEGGSLRIDTLKRIEKGEEVTTSKLLQYLHYAHEKGYDVLSDVWYYKSYQDSSCEENIDISDDNDGLENPSISIENNKTNNIVLEDRNPTSDGINNMSSNDVPTTPEEKETVFDQEELPPPEDEEYDYAEISFYQKEVMNEADQIAFIKHKRCPVCGNSLKERQGRNGPFIGCSSYPKCTYTANGNFIHYSITESNKKGVTPKHE